MPENIEEIQEQNIQENVDPKGTQEDDLKDYRNIDGELDADKVRKVIEDRRYYRSQIAKLKQLPEKTEEYGKDFVIDSKFDEFLTDEDHRKSVGDLLARVDTMCLEKGIGVERNHDIKRFLLNELADKKVFDLTPLAEKQALEERILAERDDAIQNALGEATDMRSWNTNMLNWLKTFCNSDAEYEMHKKLFETNSLWALSLNKIRQAQMGNRIPVIHSDPKFSQAEWDRAFSKASREEQDKMLTERAKELTKYK